MDLELTAVGKIRANAQLVIDRFSALSEPRRNFGYDQQSVMQVEGYIERQRSTPDVAPDNRAKLIQVLGSYLGECIIRTYGGVWRQQDDQWGIFFDDSNAGFPFNKVKKQFQNGLAGGDSIVSFFELIGPLIFKKP
jgi:hypothetical protein